MVQYQDLYPCVPRDAYEKIGDVVSEKGADAVGSVVSQGPSESSAMPTSGSYTPKVDGGSGDYGPVAQPAPAGMPTNGPKPGPSAS